MLRIIVVIIMIFSISVSAKISTGIDMSISSTNSETEPYTTSTYNYTYTNSSASIVPYLSLYMGERMEFSPFIGWIYSGSTTEYRDSNDNSTYKYENHQHSIELGCRLFFHIISKEMFDISLGPEMGYQQIFKPVSKTTSATTTTSTTYSKYFYEIPWMACPLNIDIHMNDVMSLRLSTKLLSYSYSIRSYKYSGSDIEYKYHYGSLNLKSIFSPTFGFYFTF
jgi:hypothetical protein